MRNVGIDALKILACFAVVSLHFGDGGYGRRMAVPIFVFFSCYLWSCRGQKGAVHNRLLRLWIPFMVWGLLGLSVYALIAKRLSWSDVAWQLTFGYPAAQHLYYLVDLIIITLAIWAIKHVSGGACQKLVLLGLAVVCLVSQYTGLNYKLCAVMHQNLRYTIGRLAELLPCAIIGDMVGEWHFIDRRPWIWFTSALGSFIVAAIIFVLCKELPEGFGYQGLCSLVMAASICVLSIAVGEELVHMKYTKWMLPIAGIGALTPGIYFAHDVVGKTIELVTGLSHSHVLAVVVFLSSAIIAWVLSSARWTKWIISGKVR